MEYISQPLLMVGGVSLYVNRSGTCAPAYLLSRPRSHGEPWREKERERENEREGKGERDGEREKEEEWERERYRGGEKGRA